LYVNGVSQAGSFATTPTQNADIEINRNAAHQIGAANATGLANYFDGYLTEVNFIDGQALTPSSFGQIESTTGVWSPKQYAGSYGTNGFYLKFGNTSSVAALGTDSSGNGNTWTVNNVSLTAGVTYDSMLDVPVNYSDGGNGRGNYCVMAPTDTTGGLTVSEGNLRVASTVAQTGGSRGAVGVSSGKWYWEMTANVTTAGIISVGIAGSNSTNQVNPSLSVVYNNFNGNKQINGGPSVAYGATFTTGDVIGVALDIDAGTLTFYKNNVSQGLAETGLTGSYSAWVQDGGGDRAMDAYFNFGQRPFTYTPPAGFRALNTNNLPTPSIVNGANFMAATTYTGNAAARSLSNAVNNVSFQPDLVWIKSRTPGATSHALFNSVRLATKYLSSNTAGAEVTNANTLTAFGADGFSLGTDTTLVNASANSYVAWQWKRAASSGLDIVTYTGTLSTGGTVAINHNLGVAPKLVISKSLTPAGADVGNWFVWHSSAGTGNFLRLNTPDQANSISGGGGGTMIAPTSSVFYTPWISGSNVTGNTYVAYCFAEIAGFSKFGSYTGNGSADGPFVFCGFRPRWLMIKRTDVASGWLIVDSTRSATNDVRLYLSAESTQVESNNYPLDFLSNGFKQRDATFNATGGTYIFMAFAEVPSKYALAR